jgi:SAM-dependent methyltransferase
VLSTKCISRISRRRIGADPARGRRRGGLLGGTPVDGASAGVRRRFAALPIPCAVLCCGALDGLLVTAVFPTIGTDRGDSLAQSLRVNHLCHWSIVSTDFVSVTEISGDDVTVEQVERLARRYYWAAEYCVDNDVLEVACGAGQGVGFLGGVSRSVVAGDYSERILRIAKDHYRERFGVSTFDAMALPFADRSFDTLLMFEALYYVSNVDLFFAECRRVLRPGGVLLISTANKDLYDFNPSPHSHRYLGVVELAGELSHAGFEVEFFGDSPIGTASSRQRLLRPIKALAARLGLIPKSMRGKKLLKKLVFGGLVPMPPEIAADTAAPIRPVPLDAGAADQMHKVIFCAAKQPA